MSLAVEPSCVIGRNASADPWWGPDKALHLGLSGFAGAGGLAATSAAWPDGPLWARALVGAGVGFVPGLAKEGYDLMGGGDPSGRDLAWDAIGSVAGSCVTALVLRAVGEWGSAPDREPVARGVYEPDGPEVGSARPSR